MDKINTQFKRWRIVNKEDDLIIIDTWDKAIAVNFHPSGLIEFTPRGGSVYISEAYSTHIEKTFIEENSTPITNPFDTVNDILDKAGKDGLDPLA